MNKVYNNNEEPILNPRAGLVLAHDENYTPVSEYPLLECKKQKI